MGTLKLVQIKESVVEKHTTCCVTHYYLLIDSTRDFPFFRYSPPNNGLPVRQPSPDVGLGIFWLNVCFTSPGDVNHSVPTPLASEEG
jgi:hypothetical protein